METVFHEGGFVLDFSGCLNVEKLDARDIPLPIGLKFIDFIIEEEDRYLLLEVKDPSQKEVPETERKKNIEKMKTQPLINEELVPKTRDSYTFLHLMARDKKPFLLVVLMGLEALNVEPGLLDNFKNRLLRRLRQEATEPWKRRYVKDCIVVTHNNWKEHFTYGLTRAT